MALTVARVRQLLGPRLEELAGARASGETPLTDAVVNALVADYLATASVPVASAEVRARAGGEVLVRLRLRKPAFAPPVTVSLRIDQQPMFPSPAVLGLRWSVPGFAMVAPLAGSVLASVTAGPPWLALTGDRVLIDLGRALRERAPAELTHALSDLQITTREGAIVVSWTLRIDG